MNLTEKQAKVKADAEALIAKTRAGEELTEAEQTELKSLVEDAKRLKSQIEQADSAEAFLKSLGTPVTEEERAEARATVAKSLGEHFYKSAEASLTRIKGRQRVQADAPEYSLKAAGDVVTTANGVGADHMGLPDIDKAIVKQIVQRPTVATWLGAGAIAGTAITYFIEKVWDDEANGAFKTVAENAKKPGLTPPDYEEVTETLKKIAGWVKLSMEMAEDYDFIVSEINNRLLFQLLLAEEDQLLNGDGAGTNIKGLLNREGVQVATSASKAANFDELYKALQSVFTKTGLRPDGIIINPADYQDFRLAKDANGQYFAGGPFQGPYGNGEVMGEPNLWGVPTIQTTAIPKGTVLLGAGKAAATVYRKGGIRVEASNVDGEDFTHNRFTILAEERLTLAVRRPDAFVKLTLGS